MNLQERLATHNLTPAPEGVTFSRQIALLIKRRRDIPSSKKKTAPHPVFLTVPQILPHLEELGLTATGRYHLQKGDTGRDPITLYLEL